MDIKEPSLDECVDILKGLQPHYEKHHNVRYSSSSLRAAVEQVPPDNERWQEYHDLVDAFRYFEPVDPALVAPDSLLREFIGGGSYHY